MTSEELAAREQLRIAQEMLAAMGLEAKSRPASGRFTEAMSDRERLLMVGARGWSMEIRSQPEE
jgi:hypothetical protein